MSNSNANPMQSQDLLIGHKPSAEHDFPLLPSTLLWTRLLLAEASLDLHHMTQVLEQDPVAVLRLFALVRDLAPEHPSRLLRLEDQLAALNRGQLMSVFCEQEPTAPSTQAAAIRFAQKACIMGVLCRQVAETLGLPGSEAFLIGLLSDIGNLPGFLQSRVFTSETQKAHLVSIMRHYAVPATLGRFLLELKQRETRCCWTPVVDAAHELHGQQHLLRG